jgi:hypothetical protein
MGQKFLRDVKRYITHEMGGVIDRVEQGSRHYLIYWSIDGRSCQRVSCSISPKHEQGSYVAACKADIRRAAQSAK